MKLNLIAPINTLSYGIASVNILDQLIKLGHEVSLFPIGQPQCHKRYESSVRQALKNADNFDVNADCVRIWHQHDMSMFVGKGRHIGFPIFELDAFTDKEKHHLKSCDEIFVCSGWAKNIIERNNINVDTHVVPLGVDSEIFYPKMSKRKNTIFLNVGKWEKRKGHDVLIKAFQKAFPNETNVELWMMPENPFLNEDQKRSWKSLYNDSRVRILPNVETDEQVAEVMRQADCGVFPSHAEGWNLPAIELLSCGKQIVATDYSAHTEFLTQENSCLLPIGMVESAHDGIWFHGQGRWAKFTDNTIDATSHYMAYIHNKKQNGILELNMEGIKTAEKFSWKNSALKLIKALS